MMRALHWLTLLLFCWSAFAGADEATMPMRAEQVGAHSWYVLGLPGAASRANQAFKELGAEIWAHEGAKSVLGSDAAADRLAQRRDILAPWVGDDFKVVPADAWLSGDLVFNGRVPFVGEADSQALPAYHEAHRRNAYNTYLLMERESLQK